MQWFRNNRDSYTLECTGFGIDRRCGDCEFAVLLAVHDPDFWDCYGHLLRPTPEEFMIGIDKGAYLSSKSVDQLSRWVQRPDWVGEGLFSFVQGLKRLEAIDQKRQERERGERRVNLPRIDVLA